MGKGWDRGRGDVYFSKWGVCQAVWKSMCKGPEDRLRRAGFRAKRRPVWWELREREGDREEVRWKRLAEVSSGSFFVDFIPRA